MIIFSVSHVITSISTWSLGPGHKMGKPRGLYGLFGLPVAHDFSVTHILQEGFGTSCSARSRVKAGKVREEGWALHQSQSQGLLSKAYSLYLRLVLGLCSYRFGLWVPRMHLYMWHWQSDWQLSGGLYNTGTTFWNTVSLSVYKDSYFCDHEYEMSFLKRTCISACM